MKTYKAAVIGLGNIGFQFNLDPKRKGIWSHVSAYERCERTELVAAVEVSPEKTEVFKRQYRNIPVFETVSELMEKVPIDIVSICTPTASHYPILKMLLEYSVKAVFCEKPFTSSISEGKEMVEMCHNKKVVIAVNHTRSWDDNYLAVRDMIRDGKIGMVKAVNTFYPAQIFNIGTHLFDAIRMMIEKEPVSVSGVSFNIADSDPSISGWIEFKKNIPCTFISTGKREDLILEIDIIGDDGRVRVLENGEKIEWYRFAESARYSGYRELSLMQMEPVEKKDRFLEAINDIVRVIEGDKDKVNCTEVDGFLAVAMSFAMLESAKNNGKPIKVNI